MNPKVDLFLNRATKWRQEFEQLREILLACELTEEMKWGTPCYTVNNSNVILFHGFKEYCALSFFKGSLIKDPQGILIKPTENVQAGRQIRFTAVEEIVKMKSTLASYINQAIEIEKSGIKVKFKTTAEFIIPAEFQQKLNEIPALKLAFDNLTPGRQRAYLLYFSAPKQSKTRDVRIEKSLPKILMGKGLDD